MIVCWSIMYASHTFDDKRGQSINYEFLPTTILISVCLSGVLEGYSIIVLCRRAHLKNQIQKKLKIKRKWPNWAWPMTWNDVFGLYLIDYYQKWKLHTLSGSSAWSFWNIHDGSQCNNSAIMNVWPQYKGVSSWSSPAKTEYLFTAMTQWTQHSSKANLHNHSANAWI